MISIIFVAIKQKYDFIDSYQIPVVHKYAIFSEINCVRNLNRISELSNNRSSNFQGFNVHEYKSAQDKTAIN